MKGYLNNKEATDTCIDSEGWLHTGDIAIVDESGERWLFLILYIFSKSFLNFFHGNQIDKKKLFLLHFKTNQQRQIIKQIFV